MEAEILCECTINVLQQCAMFIIARLSFDSEVYEYKYKV